MFIATDRSALNLERQLDHDGDPLAITAADTVAVSGVPPWNWREGPGNGELSFTTNFQPKKKKKKKLSFTTKMAVQKVLPFNLKEYW